MTMRDVSDYQLVMHEDELRELRLAAEDDHGAGDLQSALLEIEEMVELENGETWDDPYSLLENVLLVIERVRKDGLFE